MWNWKTEFELGISNDLKEYYGKKLETKLSEATDKKEVQRSSILITTGGVAAGVTDKSFNQSAWGALQLYQQQLKIPGKIKVTYRETSNDTELPAAYDYALRQNYKNWVLTGFQQTKMFENWLKVGGNKAKFITSKSVIIAVDWDGSSFVPEGQFFGFGFKTNESSWIVGQAAAAYLTQTGNKSHLSSFGGGIFDGITDFNNGFLQGMSDWNESNPSKKVKFYSGNDPSNTIDLSTGFVANPESTSKINNILGTNENKPQIILPVAGQLTTSTLDRIKDSKSNQMIIGVDSNQALAFPQNKTTFFSSVEKRTAVALYKALTMLSGVPLDFISGAINDNGFEIDFVPLVKNQYVKYGFDKDFVGYSPSTISGDDASLVNKLLEDALARFKSKKPVFELMTDSTKNQDLLNGLIAKINS
ncbi:MAG: BMP family ABC transporter substrate-binding protein [Mycoplasmataceae bacterium]|nr:BMP family ABC transporter substrate-binding protein [Mycoplasmataceae bacterium]